MLPKCGTKGQAKIHRTFRKNAIQKTKKPIQSYYKKIINRDDPVYSNVMIYGANTAGNKLNAKIIAGC